jgi:DNA-binding beta-propeller fold protein YncE
MRTRVTHLFFTGAVLASGLCLATRIMAQATPQQSLLVLSKHDHALAIVDPATLKVVARAPVGPDPHEVIASSDGKTAYVSIYGGGAYHVLSVVDLIAQKALPDIDLGALNGPHGLAFAGGKLWFTAEGAKVVGRYDPVSGKIDWVMGTGQNRTHMIYVTPDQNKIYTTNVSSATVSILEKDRASAHGAAARNAAGAEWSAAGWTPSRRSKGPAHGLESIRHSSWPGWRGVRCIS